MSSTRQGCRRRRSSVSAVRSPRDHLVGDLQQRGLRRERPGAHAGQRLGQGDPQIHHHHALRLVDPRPVHERGGQSRVELPGPVTVSPSSRRSVAARAKPRAEREPVGVERSGPVGVQVEDPEGDGALLEGEGEHARGRRAPARARRSRASGRAPRRASGTSTGRRVRNATQAGPSLAVNCSSATARASASEQAATPVRRALGHQVHRCTAQAERCGRPRGRRAGGRPSARARSPSAGASVDQREHVAATLLGRRRGRLGAVHARPSTWPGQARAGPQDGSRT